MRAGGKGSYNLTSALLGACVMLLAGVVGSVAVAERMADIGPQVGDIITFSGAPGLPDGLPGQVKVVRADRPGGSCTLDLRAMLRRGSSLVIEARDGDAAPIYRLHLVGGLTAADAGGAATDCGATADLSVDRVGVETLIVAAGGVGVDQKHLAAAYLLTGASYGRD